MCKVSYNVLGCKSPFRNLTANQKYQYCTYVLLGAGAVCVEVRVWCEKVHTEDLLESNRTKTSVSKGPTYQSLRQPNERTNAAIPQQP